jgi:hypothetical protein
MFATDDELRDQAIARVKAKDALRSLIGSWVLVTVIVLAVYFFTSPGGYFWPIWPILGVGFAVVSQAWRLYRSGNGNKEARIQAEIDKLKPKG